MELIIRKGEESDFHVIMEMIKELAAFERAPNAVTNSVKQMLKDKDLFGSMVAEQDGKVVGYVVYFFAYYTWVGKSLYLEDIYVKPEFRSKKIGSILMKKIVELAKSENCKRVRWQALNWNVDALRFYENHGAKISKEWLNCDLDEKEIEQFLKKA